MSAVVMGVIRFVVGGLVVALVPVVARHLGPRPAAILMVVPAISLVSLAALWVGSGPAQVQRVALAALPGLLPVAVFLAAVAVAVPLRLPPWAAFGGATLAWAAASGALLWLRS